MPTYKYTQEIRIKESEIGNIPSEFNVASVGCDPGVTDVTLERTFNLESPLEDAPDANIDGVVNKIIDEYTYDIGELKSGSITTLEGEVLTFF